MISVSAALKEHLKSTNPLIAFCLKITKSNDSVLALTSYSKDIVYDGDTYISTPGITLGNVNSSLEMNVNTQDSSSNYDSRTLSKQNLISGELEGAAYVLMFLNPKDLTMGHGVVSTGSIGKVTIKDYDYNLELRNLFQYIQQDVGDRYSPFCRAVLGQGLCNNGDTGVVLSKWTHTGSVDTVSDSKTIVCTDIDPVMSESGVLCETDYFSYGVLTWTSGLNTDKSFQVRTHTYSESEHTIELEHAPSYQIDTGDEFSISAGCDHDMDGDCALKFKNVINFQGEPYVPGRGVLTPAELRF